LPPEKRQEVKMADFIETSNTKTAVRELIAPIADVTTFNTIVQGVITGNPFGCTAYTVGDLPQDPVIKGRERYTAHVIYQDAEANVIGLVTAQSRTVRRVFRERRRGARECCTHRGNGRDPRPRRGGRGLLVLPEVP
jgi:hypothetical protein